MFNYTETDWEWLDEAACIAAPDPDIFFPPRDKVLYKKVSDEAKTYCFGEQGQPACPVRTICLAHAIRNEFNHGIWGGMSHRERNAFVRKWQRLYKSKMTLAEYIYKSKEKEQKYGNSN